ncbi:MAG TPA: hypothetical protein VFW07_17700 [Parafilimonas sp.]|nr:hypothetical protein [Parafilimonas sp.]
MKIRLPRFQRNLILAGSSAILFCSCEKDITQENAATAINAAPSSSAFVTDNLVTVETSIMAPVTPQSFVANGQSSLAVFQITAAQSAAINQAYFSGTFPAIQYVTSEDIGVAVSHNGKMGFTGLDMIPAGSGVNLPVEVYYAPVDSATSGTTAQLSFTGLTYETNDGLNHDFLPKTAVKAQTMCLVNNIPHIFISNPTSTSVIDIDYHQVAKIELTGDTNWVLNSLPLMLSAPTLANIPQSQLIIKNQGKTVKTSSNAIQLGVNSKAQTVINFTGGFKHIAGQKEVLTVYAKTPTIGQGNNPIVTTMYPLSSFVWKDGLGAKIIGSKNERFYKEQTGQATFKQL